MLKYIPYFLLAAALCVTGPLYIILKVKKRNLSIVFKSTTTLLIASLCLFAEHKSVYLWLFFSGIVVCAAADAALEYKFKLGMILFLCGHLCYCAAYITLGNLSYISIIVFAILSGVIFMIIKLKDVGDLRVIGIIYGEIISAMVSLAVPCLLIGKTGILFCIGALCFFISDSAIALTLGKRDKVWKDILILSTYWGAQTLIALGACFI